MSNASPSVTINLDPLNPAQFFACCGLFELLSAGNKNVLANFEHDPRQPRRASFALHGIRSTDMAGMLAALKCASLVCNGFLAEEISELSDRMKSLELTKIIKEMKKQDADSDDSVDVKKLLVSIKEAIESFLRHERQSSNRSTVSLGFSKVANATRKILDGSLSLRKQRNSVIEVLEEVSQYVGAVTDGELPIQLGIEDILTLVLDWWLVPERSNKSDFKLWAGQQTTLKLVQDMLDADWDVSAERVLEHRLPMSGRFGLDPRSSWNALDFGSSPNTQNRDAYTYPATEMLAAVGLQGFRPSQQTRKGFLYSLWSSPLPLAVARAAAAGALPKADSYEFKFEVAKRSGSYSYFTFAQPLEE